MSHKVVDTVRTLFSCDGSNSAVKEHTVVYNGEDGASASLEPIGLVAESFEVTSINFHLD